MINWKISNGFGLLEEFLVVREDKIYLDCIVGIIVALLMEVEFDDMSYLHKEILIDDIHDDACFCV